MSEIKDGGPAFPVPEIALDCRAFQPDHVGMTLRDYFAAKVIHGLMSQPFPNVPFDDQIKKDAVTAYQVADAMLAARGAS